MRFDLYVSKELGISRNKANELITAQGLKLNDTFFKPSFDISSLKELRLELVKPLYVSRAALKLKGFVEELSIDLKGANTLDIGASKGGFVQILLEKGAKSIVALDVGSNQLDEALRKNPLVHCLENTDIRDFKSKERFDYLTCDLSFIGLEKVLEAINALNFNFAILLFKPQFQVGLESKRSKKGLCLDEKQILRARAKFEKQVVNYGWKFLRSSQSKFKGKEGNVEYFYFYAKN